LHTGVGAERAVLAFQGRGRKMPILKAVTSFKSE
jgi:hypothetical protein